MSDSTRLDGRVAIVTGGARGIGQGIARVLARAGARIVVGDLLDAKETIDQVRAAGGEASGVRVDLGKTAAADELISFARRTFGALDVLVNNAAIDAPEGDPVRLSDEDWQRTLDVNLTGVFACTRAALPSMLEAESGAVINISSHFAWSGAPGISPAYHASKAGVIGLTMSLSTHVAERGVRVNAIAPALVESRDFGWSEQERARRRGEYALGLGTPEDVGEAVRFLASPAARWITGTVLYMGGGRMR